LESYQPSPPLIATDNRSGPDVYLRATPALARSPLVRASVSVLSSLCS
jgi:hypothetical protein